MQVKDNFYTPNFQTFIKQMLYIYFAYSLQVPYFSSFRVVIDEDCQTTQYSICTIINHSSYILQFYLVCAKANKPTSFDFKVEYLAYEIRARLCLVLQKSQQSELWTLNVTAIRGNLVSCFNDIKLSKFHLMDSCQVINMGAAIADLS